MEIDTYARALGARKETRRLHAWQTGAITARRYASREISAVSGGRCARR